jgi:hypothetical protein
MLSPKMRIVARVNQLRTHPNSTTRALDTAFHHMRNTQSFCDVAQVAFQTAFIFHHARSTDDFQVRNLGEISQDFVLHAASEICVFFVFAKILKRKHGNRFLWQRCVFRSQFLKTRIVAD